MAKASDFIGGSSGGVPIGSLLPIAIAGAPAIYTAADGTAWLKTGAIITAGDVANYPDADIQPAGYTEFTSSLSGTSTVEGVTWDGTHFWVVSNGDDSIYQVNLDGSMTGFSFSVATQETGPRGITWDGTHLWVVGASNQAHKYATDGTYTGVQFNIDFNSWGITWDGTHFWVANIQTDNVIQYTAAGAATGVSFSVISEQSAIQGLTWDGTHFWIVGSGQDFAHQYTQAGTYTGTSVDLSAFANDFNGIAAIDGALYCVGSSAAWLVATAPFIGHPTAMLEGDAPQYMRIK